MKNKNVVIVTARAFNPKTGADLTWGDFVEAIDESNALFKGCKTLYDYKKVYEEFWNELPANPRELVFVQSIKWAN